MKDSKPQTGKVVDLLAYRKTKQTEQELARGRTPLYSSHLESKPKSDLSAADEDFGQRMQRIRTSLEKINQLMFELKKSSTEYTH